MDVRIGRWFRLEIVGLAYLTVRLPLLGEWGWLPNGLSYFEPWSEVRKSQSVV